MPNFEKHIFICTNSRDLDNPKGSCAHKGGAAICEAFKKELHTLGLKGKMRANSSGCLDQCARGPSVVIYPEGIWYRVPTPEDVKEIVQEHLVNGRPVERLRMK